MDAGPKVDDWEGEHVPFSNLQVAHTCWQPELVPGTNYRADACRCITFVILRICVVYGRKTCARRYLEQDEDI